MLFIVFNQVSKKSWFYFTYRGQLPSQLFLIDYLDAKSFEMYSDSSELKYCLLNTKHQTRNESIQNIILKWNDENPESKIHLQPLPDFTKPVMSFEKCGTESFNKSKIVKEIRNQQRLAKQGEENTYVSWCINRNGILALQSSTQSKVNAQKYSSDHNDSSYDEEENSPLLQDNDGIITSPIQPEQQTAIGNAELVRKLDQALEEQRRMKEDNRKLLELVALQGKQLREIVTNQQGSTSLQTQINQAVQEINQNVLTITNSQTQMTEAVQEIKTSQEQHHQEQGKQLNELAQDLEHVDTNIQAIVDDKSDSTFLVDSLEVTTRERDDLRSTVRSQAGKMGTVTKRLNEALSENQELKAAREKSIEYQEVITAVEGVREELRRAEQRIATHLQIADAPLGEPDFNPTYERFDEVAPSEYTTALKKICMEAKQVIKRRDHPPVVKFPAVAESRKYHIDMATALYRDKDSLFKIAKSSAGHWMDLVLLGMPVMHQYHFNLLRKSFESVLKWMSERVSEAYAKDRTQYRLMEGVWNSDEVSAGKPCECLEMTRRMCCR